MITALDGVLVLPDVLSHPLIERGLDDGLGDHLQQALRARQVIPLARAAFTSSRTAARSTSAGATVFLLAFSSGLTPTSVSVIIRPFPLNSVSDLASYTVRRTYMLVWLREGIGYTGCHARERAPLV